MKLAVKKQQWDKLVVILSLILILILFTNYLEGYYSNKGSGLDEAYNEWGEVYTFRGILLNEELTQYYISSLEYNLNPTSENLNRTNNLWDEYQKDKVYLEYLKKNPMIFGKEEFSFALKIARILKRIEFSLIIVAIIYSLFLTLIKIKTK